MGSTDGAIHGLTKIVNAGTDSGKWDLVLVAEGYQSGQLTQFGTDARAVANALLATPPFTALAAAINVYKLDVSSTDSGADDPAACGGTGAVAKTFFDASFCTGGMRRFLRVNNDAVLAAVEAALPAYEIDFAPIGDMRASAAYRLQVAKNLLLRAFHETRLPLAETRLVGRGAAIG